MSENKDEPQGQIYSILQFTKQSAEKFSELLEFIRKTGNIEQAEMAISFKRGLDGNAVAMKEAIKKDAEERNIEKEKDVKEAKKNDK